MPFITRFAKINIDLSEQTEISSHTLINWNFTVPNITIYTCIVITYHTPLVLFIRLEDASKINRIKYFSTLKRQKTAFIQCVNSICWIGMKKNCVKQHQIKTFTWIETCINKLMNEEQKKKTTKQDSNSKIKCKNGIFQISNPNQSTKEKTTHKNREKKTPSNE